MNQVSSSVEIEEDNADVEKKNIVSDIILKGIRKKDEIGFKERKSGRK